MIPIVAFLDFLRTIWRTPEPVLNGTRSQRECQKLNYGMKQRHKEMDISCTIRENVIRYESVRPTEYLSHSSSYISSAMNSLYSPELPCHLK
jgi:hypothetical protein